MSYRRPTFEDRVRGDEGAVSWINEPIDFTIDYAVPKTESATARARKRWHMTQEGESG